MKIITPEAGTKTIKFIPRSSVFSLTCVFHSEAENKDYSFSITSYYEDEYYSIIDIDVYEDLLENNFYMLHLFLDGEIIHSEKLFVTSQNPATFSVNKTPDGQPIYKSNETNNEFIIYGE